jgi:N-ethylmaleimide reductase
MTTLFDPVQLGAMQLSNRVVMAPMTRSRAVAGDIPNELHVEYYRQRANAGLIVTEGVQPSKNGKGYCRTAGIHSPEQVQSWRAVTDAVHAQGGKIVVQLMHCGRISSHHNKDADAETVAPSAIKAKGQLYSDAAGMVDHDMPRALTTAEVAGVIEEYRQATLNALDAGFDGVELHCTSGYLPAQFLSTGTNQRTDQYGGSVQNRIRFVMETLTAMSAAAGAARVGFRICPGNPFNDLYDENPRETFSALLQAATPLQLAYLHLIYVPLPTLDSLALVQENYRGAMIINESLNFEKAQEYIRSGIAAAASFGRYYVSNPDLVRRFREGAPLAPLDRNTLYTPGPQGYIDYPELA